MLGPARYMVGVTVGYMLGTAGYMGLGLGLGGLHLMIFEVIKAQKYHLKWTFK